MIIAPRLQDKDNIYLAAGDQFGSGWWGDRWKNVKTGVSKAAKAVQSSQAVRDLEKSAVKVGAKTLRGAVESGLDGVADTALTALGAPEFAPMVDKLVDKGVKTLEKKGTAYVDQKIDASGKGHGGVRYMSAGGGLRLSGSGTRVGSGLRLAGGLLGYADWEEKKSRELAGAMGLGMRLSGSGHGWGSIVTGFHKDMAERAERHKVPHMPVGNGMRVAGSGIYARPLLEGSGCACH